MAELPDGLINGFRIKPRYIKCENDSFCMPDTGECIWVFSLKDSRFYQLEISNSYMEGISIIIFWKSQAE